MTKLDFYCEEEIVTFLATTNQQIQVVTQISIRDDQNKQSDPCSIQNLIKFANMTNLNLYEIKSIDLTPLLQMSQIVDLFFTKCTFDVNAQLQFTIHALNLYLNHGLENPHILKKRKYRAAENYDEQKLTTLFQQFNQFVEFSLFKCQVNNLKLLTQLQQLKKLEIENCQINDFTELQNLKLLEELCLNQLGIKDLNLLEFCIQLKSLTVQKCDQIIDYTEMQKCRQLNKLEINSMNIKDLNMLLFCVWIKILTIQYCQKIINWDGIQKCLYLENIELNQTSIQKLEVITNIGKIKKLHLKQCMCLTDINHLKNCKFLNNIEFQQVGFLQQNGIISLNEQKQLNIKGLWEQWFLNQLLRSNYETLKIEDSCDINIIEMQKLDTLQKFEIDSCFKVNNIELISQYTKLKLLSIENTNLTSKDGYIRFEESDKLEINGLLSQKVFDMLITNRNFEQMKITNSSITNFNEIKKGNELNQLDLINCHKIQNIEGLNCCAELKKLNILNIDQISGSNNNQLMEFNQFSINGLINQLTFDMLINYKKYEQIKITNSDLTDFNKMKSQDKLQELEVLNCSEIQNIEGLRHCSELKKLVIKNTSLTSQNGHIQITELGLLDINGLISQQVFNFLVGQKQYGQMKIDNSNLTDIDEFKNQNELKELELTNCMQIQNVEGLKHCIELKQLTIKNTSLTKVDGCIQINQPDLLDIIGLISQDVFSFLLGYKTYTQIKIDNSDVTDFNEMKNQEKLQKLEISNCMQIQNIEGLKHCIELKILSIKNTNLTTKDGYVQIVQPNQLEIIGLINQQMFVQLMNCKVFNQLKIDSSSIINFDAMKEQDTLQVLSINNCTTIQDIDGLKYCSELKFLTIKNTKLTEEGGHIKMDDEKMEIKGLLEQKHFDQLMQCQCFNILNVENSNIEHCNLMMNQTKLINLKINNCIKLQNIGGLKNCINIQAFEIELALIWNLNGLKNMKNLEKLSILNCQNLMDIYGLLNCSTLKEILIQSTSIKDLSVFNNFKQLQKIQLLNCNDLQNIDGLNDCKEIKTVKIQNCGIWNIDPLSDKIKLQHLEIIGCQYVTHIDQLKQCYQLQHIQIEKTSIDSISALTSLENVQYLKVENNKNLKENIELKEQQEVLLYLLKLKNTENNQQLCDQQLEQQIQHDDIRNENPNRFKNSIQLKNEELQELQRQQFNKIENLMEEFQNL